MVAETVRLAVAMADAAGRFGAAQRLAEHTGATALLMLVHDRAVDAYVPAAGFPPTLPGGTGWRNLLAMARRPGLHRGVVGFPHRDTPVEALAYSDAGLVLAFLGGTPRISAVEELAALVPLIASMLRAEQDSRSARGEMRVALDHAREAEALAMALDAARAELERTLRVLEDRSRALDEARARAEQAVRAKDEFLAMLGHELRNPLSPITTAVHLLRLKGHVGREHEVIERQVTNLIRLVDDLLDVSRLTTGKIALRKAPVEIANVAARAIEMVSPMLERKRQVLSVNVPATGLVVDGDATRLAQVLANLLTNAAKYSDDETTIRLDAVRDGARVRVRVADEGIGISREMLDRVFDLFEQQRQAIDRSHGGLGLGLAIVRSLVTLHGGTVHVLSEGEGRGAEFVVELPLAAGVDTDGAPHDASDHEAETEQRGTRVLVVDDNEDALTMLSDALSTVGYDVRTARDGPSALAVAERFHPDMAVLDIGLPVMDGYELAERLRDRDGDRSLGLVAVTGYGQDADRRRARAAGFDAHLVKPVSFDELRAVLAKLWSQKRADKPVAPP